MTSIWLSVLIIAALDRRDALWAFVVYAQTVPYGVHVSFTSLWNIFILSIPLGLFAFCYVSQKKLLTTPVVACCAAMLLIGVVFLWDDRSTTHKLVDAAPFPAELAALVPADQSEVLWMGDPEPWYLLDHPSWGLFIQGAGIVFSRPLSMLWQERMKALVSLDLAGGNILAPWSIPPAVAPLQVTRNAVDRLCTRTDAPSTIVAPIEEGMSYPQDLAYRRWRPPVDMFRLTQDGEIVSWHKTIGYIVISCAHHELSE
jgi:hypothetical protein